VLSESNAHSAKIDYKKLNSIVLQIVDINFALAAYIHTSHINLMLWKSLPVQNKDV